MVQYADKFSPPFHSDLRHRKAAELLRVYKKNKKTEALRGAET